MSDPGRLLASGRDADIFEYGKGRVLRRSRVGHSVELEARTMDYVRGKGYPVPRVDDVLEDGRALVMERVVGPTMVVAASSRPWRIGRLGSMLADLHLALHEIEAPPWVGAAPVGEGDRLLHLDLHPLNVLMSPTGPVVIDWTNAVRGNPAVDVTLTWALMSGGSLEGGPMIQFLVRTARHWMLRSFLAPFDEAERVAQLADVVEWKVRDPHLSPVEVARMRALVGEAQRER